MYEGCAQAQTENDEWPEPDPPAGAADGDHDFSDRLNRLFESVYPLTGRPFRSADLVNGLRTTQVSPSSAYVSQLRTRRRTKPSQDMMEAIAAFFRMPIEYFTDDEYYRLIDDDLTLLARRRDEKVRRLVCGLADLSPEAREKIEAAIDALYEQQDAEDVG